MSYSKVAFATLFGIYSSCCLGMEPTTFQYSNPYFDQELQKSLTLIMLKNRNTEQVTALDKDILNIIAKNSYDLYCDELLKSKIKEQSFEKFWQRRFDNINDQKRIDAYYGQKININDFDFLVMNDQGRKIFLTAMSVCDRDYKYQYSSQYSHEFNQQSINDHKKRTEKSFLFDDNEYKKILQLPIRLRSKLGNLSQMIIIGKEQFSCENAFLEYGLLEGVMGGFLSIFPTVLISTEDKWIPTIVCAGICGIGSYHVQKKDEMFPTPTSLVNQLFFNGKMYSTKTVREKILKRHCPLIKKPLVPEKYAETLALQQEFQQSQKNILNIQQQTTQSLLTHE